MIEDRSDSYSIAEIESLLLVQENCIECHMKELDSSTSSVNLVSKNSHNQYFHGEYGGSSNGSSIGYGHSNSGHNTNYGNPSYERGYGGRASGNYHFEWFISHEGLTQRNSTRPICQLCGKTNHSVMKCYHYFDSSWLGLAYVHSAQFHSPSPITTIFATPETISNPNWYLDSGPPTMHSRL